MKAAAQTQRHTLIRHLVTATAWTLAQQLVVTVTGGGRGMGEEGLAMDEGRGGGEGLDAGMGKSKARAGVRQE